MKNKQVLNNYTKDYFLKLDWVVFKTKHHVFHFFKDSVAGQELKKISRTQDQAYCNIIKTLAIRKPVKTINYYIYPSVYKKKKLMGDDGFAQAIWHDNSIHLVYNEKIKPLGEHEEVHLLTLSWGVAIGFFAEGLAEYMSGCKWGKKRESVNKIVAENLKNYHEFTIKDMFSHQNWAKLSDRNINFYYPLACSFTKFLIKTYGIEKYKKFYKRIKRNNTINENTQIFERIFRLSISEAELKWKTELGF